MTNKQISLSLLFVWCIFMGITGISIGLGAVFPSVNRIARPFVCPRGEMQLETQEYNPSPVQTVTTLTWYCVDGVTGERVELELFPMSLYAGTIYGFLLFLVILAGMKFILKRSFSRRPRVQDDKASRERGTGVDESKPALDRMKELQAMRAANLISEAEYEQKRVEILKSL